MDSIVVSDLSDDTFYAKIVLQVNGSTMEVDSRPSDALALAVRTELAHLRRRNRRGEGGDSPGRGTGKAMHVDEDEDDEPRPVTEEERAKLSAFEDFIGSLDLGLGTGRRASTQRR